MLREPAVLDTSSLSNSERNDTDALLVGRIRAGDADAFDLVMERYQAGLFGYLHAFLGDREQARDLVQDTFFKAYRSLDSLADPALLRSWLYRIAHNQACSLLRRRRLIAWLPLAFVQHTPSTGHSDLDAMSVRQALVQVPLEQRAPLLLHLIAGFSYNEIATLLHVSEGAVRMRISRGRAAFRAAYGEEGDDAS